MPMSPSRYSKWSALLLSCMLASGCAVLDAPFAGELITEDREKSLAAPDVPSFLVEVRPEGKQPERFRLPLAEEDTYVQQVLEKSGVLNRFARVQIELWRPLPDDGGRYKLDIPFDRNSHTIATGYDYAVHAKDLLVLKEDPSNILDDMLDTVSSPLANFRR